MHASVMQFNSFSSVFYIKSPQYAQNTIKQMKGTSEREDTIVIFFSSDLFTNKIK